MKQGSCSSLSKPTKHDTNQKPFFSIKIVIAIQRKCLTNSQAKTGDKANNLEPFKMCNIVTGVPCSFCATYILKCSSFLLLCGV